MTGTATLTFDRSKPHEDAAYRAAEDGLGYQKAMEEIARHVVKAEGYIDRDRMIQVIDDAAVRNRLYRFKETLRRMLAPPA